jgi:predicted nucleotidyltransferase component of viral defense system
MIKPGEIQQKAREVGVRDQQIEKDYILSWILKGIAQHQQLSKAIVFKGGTVLKKIYFEAYRFSEDLDFTLFNNFQMPHLKEIDNEQIFLWFNQVFDYVKEGANILLAIIENDEDEDARLPAGTGGINFYINYTGPLGGIGSNKKVKVDISRSEQLEYMPVVKDVIIGYSDIQQHQLLCYPLEEVLIEKMRAVMQRMQARDLYDIWFLLEQHGMEAAFHVKEFEKKCASKNLKHVDFPKKLAERLPQYKGRWKNSLNEQIKDLPDFEQVERAIQRKLRKWKI